MAKTGRIKLMRKPNANIITAEESISVSDGYEFSMADTNFETNHSGILCIFNAALRSMPSNKVIGRFKRDGITYDELGSRNYMINAGIEQIIAMIMADHSSETEKISDYYRDVIKSKNKEFIEWVKHVRFKGNIYAMEEGVPFFSHEPQMKIKEVFETAQVFESIILSTLNRETNVATTAHDIHTSITNGLSGDLKNKVFSLIEGASRRTFGPQDSVNVSRSAIIGGFTHSSNVKYNMLYNSTVKGTHGHSYVLLHGEYKAFKYQSKKHGDNVVFLLDTFNVKNAMKTALRVIREDGRKKFGFRIDSGDLLEQSLWIHDTMKKECFLRDDYKIFASDDLTAGKIKLLEENGADIDAYLVGTFLSIQSKGPGIVYKLTSKYKKEDNEWVATSKSSADPSKATIGGDLQVYRILGSDGFYKYDYIALAKERMLEYLDEDDTAIPLLKKIVKKGEIVYDFPSPEEISKKLKNELLKFRDIDNYEVRRTLRVEVLQNQLKRRNSLN